MRQILIGLCVSTIAVHLGGAFCAGQLVVVRPGFVKAPFVRVYWGPDGRSFVRAPFVAVESPPRVIYPYRVLGEPTPAEQDVADMDWGTLRRTVRDRLAQFRSDLRTFPTGEVWTSHFGLEVIDMIARVDSDAPLSEEERQTIGQLLVHYDAATQDPAMQAVTRLTSFRRLRSALDEWWKPVGQRMRERLARSGSQLHEVLSHFSTGKGWQEYLDLPTPIELRDDASEADRANANQAFIEDLVALLGRFESVTENSNYRVIAQLPEFQATHDRLAACIAWLTDASPGGAPLTPEELPPPRPSQ